MALQKMVSLTVFGFILALSSLGSSLNLRNNGGYDLVVAVDERALLPAVGLSRYIENIQSSMQTFSNQLWRATKTKFFINSVELVLPGDWNYTSDAAASRNYQTADFRLSPEIVYPYADNPNLCGLPGKFVELPLDFFGNANSNSFGPIWKTLMVLFARYRYGVWEEHGYVGDSRFPYTFQNDYNKWEVTGCSNKPLDGKFVSVIDSEDCDIDENSPIELLQSCRFIPSRNNTATTSLMHFHWMDSVVDFCDHTTHNKDVENKQNTFCDHRSVMEVIESSPDFKTVTNSTSQLPRVSFKTVTATTTPLFYVLLDRGLVQGPFEHAQLVARSLAAFFNRADLRGTIAAMGTYPGRSQDTYTNLEVPWGPIGQNLDAFIRTIGNVRLDGPLERDFSRAVLEVVETIREQHSPRGSAILVIKNGADVANIGTWAPESDLIVALNEESIFFNAIELAISNREPVVAHLSQVSTATNGAFAALTSSFGDAERAVSNVLDYVRRTLTDSDILMTTRSTVYKSTVAANSLAQQIPVPGSGSTRNLEIFYSSRVKLQKTDFTINLQAVPSSVQFIRSVDWNEIENTTAFSYSFRMNSASLGATTSIDFNATCPSSSSCGGSVIARTVVGTVAPEDEIDVEVSSSSNAINLSENAMVLTVKVTKAGVPVDDAVIVARVVNTLTADSETVELQDDGIAPDVMKEDGIHTGSIVPKQDGSYKVYVNVRKGSSNSILLNSGSDLSEHRFGRLLPIDQGAADGCAAYNNCTLNNLGKLPTNFVKVFDVSGQFNFTEAANFKAAPGKIFSLLYYRNSSLWWVAPRVPGQDPRTSVDSYEIRKASTRTQLIEDYDSCEIVPGLVPPSRPGGLEHIQLPSETSSTFYAVKATFQTARSERSNIVGFSDGTMVSPTTVTPTTTPTTVDPTAPPTTVDPTAPPTTVDPTAPPTTVDPTAPPTTVDPTAPPTTVDPTAPPTTVDPTAPTPSTVGPDPSTTSASHSHMWQINAELSFAVGVVCMLLN